MARINPNDKQFDDNGSGGGERKQISIGRKLLAAVGFERYSSRNGNPMISVRFICLQDYEGGVDDRAEVYENFTLTERAYWRIVGFARALGYPDAFDPDVDEDISSLLTHGYVEANIQMDTWQGKERPKIDQFSRAGSVSEDPEWKTWIEEGEERHRGYLDWRKNNPRDGASHAAPARSPARGSTSGRVQDADIPF